MQSLSIPVFVYTGKDSIPIFSAKDSIILNQVVTQMPDTVNLSETRAFQPVSRQFNYPYWIIGLIILGVIAIVVAVIWGREITKRIKLYRLKRSLRNFSKNSIRRLKAFLPILKRPKLNLC